MKKMAIPYNVRNLMSQITLNYKSSEKKAEVFVVGGCVRDSLLGKKPKDYDLTTNLTPDEIKEIFSGPDYGHIAHFWADIRDFTVFPQ